MEHFTTPLIPVFNGTWVESVRGRKCIITNGPKNNILTVSDIKERKKFSHCPSRQAKLILLDPKEKTVLLCANWGKKGALRSWKGVIEKDGNRIRWGGLKGITYWNRKF